MLMRVRRLLGEHRDSAAFHSSERDPAYLKLIMIEQGLKGRLNEAAVAPMPGQPAAPGAVAGQPAVNPAQVGMDMAKKKTEMQAQLRSAQEQVKNAQAQVQAIQKQISQPNLGMSEATKFARRRLRESEIQQAQVVLAAQDMVDQVQKMLEQISAMQFKDLPALTDSIKNDMGIDQATEYQSATTAALTQLLQSMQTGKTALEGAQGTLTGQAPVVPGDTQDADMDPDMSADMSADMDPDMDAELPAVDDDEEPTPLSGAGLGRERRVSEAAKKNSKPDFLDMDKDGNTKETMKKAVADKKKNPFAKTK
jgi:DNA repair exonuclease SbcCD ATPase subunit